MSCSWGTSKLVSYGNLHAMIMAGVEFIASESKLYVSAAELAGLDTNAAAIADCPAEGDAGKPAGPTGVWRVFEDTLTVPGKKKTDPALRLRRVFVHSSARAGAAATAWGKKLDRVRDDPGRLVRGLGSRHYPTAQTVTDRVAAIDRDRRVKTCLRSGAGTDPVTGKPAPARRPAALFWAADAQQRSLRWASHSTVER